MKTAYLIEHVSFTLEGLTGKDLEHYLRPNGDIIAFFDGHFADTVSPKTCVDCSETITVN
jgi:hypothetical protein